MNTKTFGFATVLCAISSMALAAPNLTVVPGGVQANNWVWNIDIGADTSLVPDGSGTPLAIEMGFRLTGAQLLSATIADPSIFDTPNPGNFIFGWETPDPFSNNHPYGLQLHGSTSEIFVSYGSINLLTSAPHHFLKVITSGPGNGGASLSSTIQWLGAYGGGKGRIAQITGGSGSFYTVSSFDIYAGSATQAVPEPASVALLAITTIVMPLNLRRRRRDSRLD